MEVNKVTETGKTREEMTLEQHLLSRGLVNLDVLTVKVMEGANAEEVGTAEITENEGTLEKVADCWSTHADAIRAVIAGRVRPLIVQAALKDIPQEVTVTRQAIVELMGLLDDFEKLHKELTARKANRAEGQPEAQPVDET